MNMPAVTLALVITMAGAAGAVDIESEARAVGAMLIAPCCFSQQVSVHHSPTADEMRADIRRRLLAGETRQQILDAYVAQYGTRVLAQPRAEGTGWLLYLVPPLALVLTAGLAWMIVRRMTHPQTATGNVSVQDTTTTSGYAESLDQELRDVD